MKKRHYSSVGDIAVLRAAAEERDRVTLWSDRLLGLLDDLEEARAVRDQMTEAYRDAIGVPPSEHTERRLEAMAKALELLRERIKAKADEWDEICRRERSNPTIAHVLRSLLDGAP